MGNETTKSDTERLNEVDVQAMLEGAQRHRGKAQVPIVVADDSTLVRKLVIKNFEKVDPRIVWYEATNGNEVFTKLQEIREVFETDPALIILDLEMPEMDGWETMTALKKEYEEKGKNEGVPLVVFSSTSGKKGIAPFSKDVHKNNIGYKPFVTVAKEECTEPRRYDAIGEGGLEAWLSYFLGGSTEEEQDARE